VNCYHSVIYLQFCTLLQLLLSDAHTNLFFALYRIWSIISVIFIVKSLVGSTFFGIIIYLHDDDFKSKYVGEKKLEIG
jgi:hypothetical protein